MPGPGPEPPPGAAPGGPCGRSSGWPCSDYIGPRPSGAKHPRRRLPFPPFLCYRAARKPGPQRHCGPFYLSDQALRRVRHVQILVRDNNVDQALRALKKKMQREGVFREMKLRRNYEKPSERRAREKAEAVRRYRKLLRKRMDREGY